MRNIDYMKLLAAQGWIGTIQKESERQYALAYLRHCQLVGSRAPVACDYQITEDTARTVELDLQKLL